MNSKREDLETLRLLRAFTKIADPAKRREVIEQAEKHASPKTGGEACVAENRRRQGALLTSH
jgi:hypothetical protein